MKKRLLLLLLALPCTYVQAQNLRSIYELALENDPRLREARANRDAVLENRAQGVGRLLPSLTVHANLQRNSVLYKFKNPILTFISGGHNLDFWTSGASVNLYQPIYHHELWAQLAQADSQIAEAEANFAAEQQNLIVRTAQAYFNVLLAQDTLDFALAEQRAIDRQLAEAKERFAVGMASVTDVHEAQAGFDQARANAIAAANELENAKEALREIVGSYTGELDGLIETIPLNKPRPDDIEAWSNLALQNNLGIIAAQNNADAAKKNIDLQFAGHLPTLDLVGHAGFTDTNRPFGIRTEYQDIGMEINVPVFAGGGVTSRVRQARHQFEAAQERLDTQRRLIRRQVKNAFRGVATAISQVQALKAAVVSSKSAVEAAQSGFEVGTRTMVDVLTVQRNMYRTLRDYARTRYDYILNSLSLKQAASTLEPEDLALVNSWLSPRVRPSYREEDRDDGDLSQR